MKEKKNFFSVARLFIASRQKESNAAYEYCLLVFREKNKKKKKMENNGNEQIQKENIL